MTARTLSKETAAALLLATLIFAPGATAVAQTTGPPPNPLMPLPELVKAGPGCLQVETAMTNSGKMVIFARFENRKAALA